MPRNAHYGSPATANEGLLRDLRTCLLRRITGVRLRQTKAFDKITHFTHLPSKAHYGIRPVLATGATGRAGGVPAGVGSQAWAPGTTWGWAPSEPGQGAEFSSDFRSHTSEIVRRPSDVGAGVRAIWASRRLFSSFHWDKNLVTASRGGGVSRPGFTGTTNNIRSEWDGDPTKTGAFWKRGHPPHLMSADDVWTLSQPRASTGQKSHRVCTGRPATRCFVLIEQSDSPVRTSSELTVRCRTNAPPRRETLSNGLDGSANRLRANAGAGSRGAPRRPGRGAVLLAGRRAGSDGVAPRAETRSACDTRKRTEKGAEDDEHRRPDMSHRQMHERERPSHRPENAEHRRPRPPSPTRRTPTTTATPKDHYDTLNPRRKARTERTLQPRTGSSLHTGTARPTQSSEPILLPKTCADGGYGPTRAAKTGPGFSRAASDRTPPEPRRSTGRFSVSPDEPIPRTRSFTKKNSSGALGDVSGLACVTAVSPEATRRHRHRCQQRRREALSPTGFGNINPIPFRRKAGRSSFAAFCLRTTKRLTDPAPFPGRLSPASHSIICYYHQDLHPRSAPPGSRPRLPCSPRRPPTRRGIGQARASFSSAQALLAATVRHRSVAPAPSIFGAADSDFRGHRPAVYIDRHPFGDLMGVALGTLAGRLVHPTAPVLLTKSGPLGTRIRFCRRRDDEGGREVGRLRIRESRPVPPVPSSRVGRGRERPRGLQSFALPDGIAKIERQLS
ncbi:unnamed protein product [Acanthosepion pharaonis]|uniref:Uncharacterized protein n=1 Tax=Acanthosepion pharaonis TaxID=158019 RepID=A0A812DTK8_ACAPH|nr:unnamed protein product [Sepia pharaonis]